MSQLQAQIGQGLFQDARCGPIVKRTCRSGQGRGAVPVMPRLVPAELSAWLEERHADLPTLTLGDNCPRIHFEVVRRSGAPEG